MGNVWSKGLNKENYKSENPGNFPSFFYLFLTLVGPLCKEMENRGLQRRFPGQGILNGRRKPVEGRRRTPARTHTTASNVPQIDSAFLLLPLAHAALSLLSSSFTFLRDVITIFGPPFLSLIEM